MSRFPAIPEPVPDPQSLYHTVMALKEAVESLTRENSDLRALTLQDVTANALLGTFLISTAATKPYEAGTWLPTLTTDGTDFTSVTYDSARRGYYVKIGDLVFIYGQMITDAVTVGSATGHPLIGNMPFVAFDEAPVVIGPVSGWAGEMPNAGRTRGSANSMRLYYRVTTPESASVESLVADVGTGANANSIYFSALYTTR